MIGSVFAANVRRRGRLMLFFNCLPRRCFVLMGQRRRFLGGLFSGRSLTAYFRQRGAGSGLFLCGSFTDRPGCHFLRLVRFIFCHTGFDLLFLKWHKKRA